MDACAMIARCAVHQGFEDDPPGEVAARRTLAEFLAARESTQRTHAEFLAGLEQLQADFAQKARVRAGEGANFNAEGLGNTESRDHRQEATPCHE
jgi:hypothetical protein